MARERTFSSRRRFGGSPLVLHLYGVRALPPHCLQWRSHDDLPIVWALYIALKQNPSCRSPALVLSGVLLCCAFLIKQPAAIAALRWGCTSCCRPIAPSAICACDILSCIPPCSPPVFSHSRPRGPRFTHPGHLTRPPTIGRCGDHDLVHGPTTPSSGAWGSA